MDFRYYKEIPTYSSVWYKLIDVDGKLVEDFAGQPCFGELAHGFSVAAWQIHIYHDQTHIPYDVIAIKRWIADISEMGFPCFFEQDEDPIIVNQVGFLKETIAEGLEETALMLLRHGEELPVKPHNFFVNIYDYEDKNHMFSTLFLIRCLTETGINRVPEEYFKLMDAEPARDKLDACQTAHKIVSRRDKPYDARSYANTDHMVTHDGNGDVNITKATLMERFSTRKTPLRDKGFLRITANWNGSNDKTWQGKTNE